MTKDNQNLVQEWIEYSANPKGNENLFWAWESVDDAVHDSPEEAWALILALIEEAPNNAILADVAAGPLENLVVYHSAKFIERIDEMARKSPKFRLCLTGVWCKGSIPEEHYKIIQLYVSTVEKPL